METQIKLQDKNYYIKDILKSLKNKQANSVIRGFYYQSLVTIREWIKCHIENKQYKIYCEVEDDIKVEISEHIKYIQVKCYKKPFSLKNEEVLKSLFTFLRLYIIHKNKDVKFVFESNTYFCKNEKLNILEKWNEYKIQSIEIDEIKKQLIKKYNKKISENQIYRDLINNQIQFRNFIKSIEIKLDCVDVEHSIEYIKKEILKNILEEKNYKNLFAVLLKEVMDKSSNKKKQDRVLDENIFNLCIQNSIYETKEYELYNEVLNGQQELCNDHKKILNKQEKIYDVNQRIEKKIDKLTEIRRQENELDLLVTSRMDIKEDYYTLNLKQFFKFDNSRDCYRKIKNSNIWNNELLKKIDAFFENIIKEQSDKKKVIELKNLHYSIAFYLGHEYGKALNNPYLKRDGVIYKIKDGSLKCNNKIVCKKILLNKGNDIAVIINTSRNPEIVKKQVKNFIDKSGLKIGNIFNLTLGENTNQYAINKYNFYYIASQISKIIEPIESTIIHLFSITTLEELFTIGRLLFDRKNIILYEYMLNLKEYKPTIKLI